MRGCCTTCCTYDYVHVAVGARRVLQGQCPTAVLWLWGRLVIVGQVGSPLPALCVQSDTAADLSLLGGRVCAAWRAQT